MALYGAASLRIGYGLAGLAYYLRNYSDRHYLWGPSGVYPFDSFRDSIISPGFNIYQFTESSVVFELLFHSGIIVSVLFCLGVGGRVMTVGHYIFLVSLYLRNPALLDGGDNLAYIVLLYLIAVDTTAALAARRRKEKPRDAKVSIVVHNSGIMLIAIQLFIVYWTSALYKIQGKLWQDGTALYYILRVPEFSWPPVTDNLIRYAWVVVIATYFTVFFQLLFPLLVAIRETRVPALLLAMLFHICIAVFMGLTSFSLYMIATEAVLLSDQHYRRLGISVDKHLDRLLERPTKTLITFLGKSSAPRQP